MESGYAHAPSPDGVREPSVIDAELEAWANVGMAGFGLARSARVLKRAFDLIASSLVLILALPLMAAIAVAIKLDSWGPVLFHQPRIGRRGETFELLKFRSMEDGADAHKHEYAHMNEANGLFKIRRDPRITRVGGRIREYSLDELPQLFNVLRGEMSLVGPRPLIAEEDSQIAARRRLDVAPGITGPSQVLGSWRVPLDEIAILDYRYVADWSLRGDLRLLVQTIRYVVGRNGA